MNIYVNGIDLTNARRVLLATENEDMTFDDVIEAKMALEGRFPGIEFVFVTGFKPVAIAHGPSYEIEVADA